MRAEDRRVGLRDLFQLVHRSSVAARTTRLLIAGGS
jgi:hypothetical protein